MPGTKIEERQREMITYLYNTFSPVKYIDRYAPWGDFIPDADDRLLTEIVAQVLSPKLDTDLWMKLEKVKRVGDCEQPSMLVAVKKHGNDAELLSLLYETFQGVTVDAWTLIRPGDMIVGHFLKYDIVKYLSDAEKDPRKLSKTWAGEIAKRADAILEAYQESD